MSGVALEVRNLNAWVATRTGRHRVLDDVSFDLEAGEATALVGESGCGKSLTALAILGLAAPNQVSVEAASIRLGGRDISNLSRPALRSVLGNEIAMIFQQPGTALDPVFTIGQQVAAAYRRHSDAGPRRARIAALEALDSVGFGQPEEIAGAYPHELSGGMRQLAMIAMATVCNPSVLIADEPTTALDSHARAFILNRLDALRRDHGTTILLISHDLASIRHCCRRVMIMYCGRLVEMAETESLFRHPAHPYSAGLLACIPRVGGASVAPITGQVPAIDDKPSGCHFAPRCERVAPTCRQTAPRLEKDRPVACHRPLP